MLAGFWSRRLSCVCGTTLIGHQERAKGAGKERNFWVFLGNVVGFRAIGCFFVAFFDVHGGSWVPEWVQKELKDTLGIG